MILLKSLLKYSAIFSLGLIIGLFFLWKSTKSYKTKQIDIISNGIKNVSKLIVTEANYSEVYNYQDTDKYLFETFEFKKKVILLISAKVQVSYDLKKLDIKIDTLQKKLIINKIPKEELVIIPDYKYYDFQQSMWNTFSKEELNDIQQNSLEQLITTVEISNVKEKARIQLIKELENLLHIAKLVDWEVVDQSEVGLLNEIELKLKI
ncbi:MAG TPA: DUF4230 domain-containing protein [Lutibacter sp.]|nr:DUF4230 domain-containing protein [Lutibacter sp.]